MKRLNQFSSCYMYQKFFLLWLAICFIFSSSAVAQPVKADLKAYALTIKHLDTIWIANNDGEDDLGAFFEKNPADPMKKIRKNLKSEELDDFFQEDPDHIGNDVIAKDSFETSDSNFRVNGEIGLLYGYRYNYNRFTAQMTDHQGVSHLKTKFLLDFGISFSDSWNFLGSGTASYNFAYQFNQDNNYTLGFLNENESQFELKKLFIRGNLTPNIDLKIGRQIVVWGKSDSLRVTDILNPLDLREPGMTDIEDLRQPIFMSRFDYYYSNYSFTGYLIHEHMSHTLPVLGSSYYYFPVAIDSESDPSLEIDNTEYAVSINGIFQGYDFSLYAANIYDDNPYLTKSNTQAHQRISMFGGAFNTVRNSFLFKTEAAFFSDLKLSAFRQNGILIENTNAYHRLDLMTGLEYSGFENTNMSIEVVDRWMTNYNHLAMLSGAQEHLVQYVFRVSRTFLNDVLETSVLVSLYGKKADDGGFIRVQGEYDISDNLMATAGVVIYMSGSTQILKQIGENDIVFFKLTYSF